MAGRGLKLSQLVAQVETPTADRMATEGKVARGMAEAREATAEMVKALEAVDEGVTEGLLEMAATAELVAQKVGPVASAETAEPEVEVVGTAALEAVAGLAGAAGWVMVLVIWEAKEVTAVLDLSAA